MCILFNGTNNFSEGYFVENTALHHFRKTSYYSHIKRASDVRSPRIFILSFFCVVNKENIAKHSRGIFCRYNMTDIFFLDMFLFTDT